MQPDLDPKLRARQEKKLEELRAAAAAHVREELERKYAVRYHKVKFFERVKLERRERQLRQQLAATGEDEAATAPLHAQLEEARLDLQYVLHFPKGEKYVSILKDPETEADRARVQSERARLRALVAAELARAALVGEADEGKSIVASLRQMQGAEPRRAAAPAAERPADADAGASADEADDFFLDGASDAETAALDRPDAAATARQPPRQQQALSGPLPKAKEKRPVREKHAPPAGKPGTLAAESGGSGRGPAVRAKLAPMPAGREPAGKPADPREPGAPRLRISGEHAAAKFARRTTAPPMRGPAPVPAQPLRKRAEGGRKRRKKSD